jgi:hypothetical protein
MRRRLAHTFVNLSQAYRDLVINFSVTLFDPKDVLQLRNLMQGVIRTLLSLKSETRLFEDFPDEDNDDKSPALAKTDDFIVEMEPNSKSEGNSQEYELLKFVAGSISEPTELLLRAMKASLQSCDAVSTAAKSPSLPSRRWHILSVCLFVAGGVLPQTY